jgi:hypothetical protein
MILKPYWRGGRVVDRARLEIECTERYRGFKSHPLRNYKIARGGFYPYDKLACPLNVPNKLIIPTSRKSKKQVNSRYSSKVLKDNRLTIN